MKAMSGNILIFKLGVYDKDVLLSYLIEFNKMSIRFVDGNNLKASDYIDMPYNEWSMAGISEAFESSYRACLTRLASSMVPPSS